MLREHVNEWVGTTLDVGCDKCQEPAVIVLSGYGDGKNGECNWCAACAADVVRKVGSDLATLRRNAVA